MRNKQILKRKLLIPLILVLISALAFFIYTGNYYHEDEFADQAMDSTKSVEVIETDYGYFFDGIGKDHALIFYPGGKVDEKAYAPLMHQLAQNGIDTFLIRMPFHLAVMDMYKADQIDEIGRYDHVYIGGHSLGGAVASIYAAKNNDLIDGLILIAAYPDTQLDEDMKVFSIYGSNDQILNREKYQESKKYISGKLIEYVINGGNHSQFGSYGFQKGDGEASISMDEQIDQTVDAISVFILGE